MSRRLSDEKIKKRYAKVGLEVLDVENYKNRYTKLTCLDKEGYKVYRTLSIITRYESSENLQRFSVNNPYTIENIKRWLLINDPNYELVTTEYTGSRQKLEWRE